MDVDKRLSLFAGGDNVTSSGVTQTEFTITWDQPDLVYYNESIRIEDHNSSVYVYFSKLLIVIFL